MDVARNDVKLQEISHRSVVICFKFILETTSASRRALVSVHPTAIIRFHWVSIPYANVIT